MVPNHSFKCTKPIENHHQQQIIDHSIVLTNWLSLRARVFKSVQKNIYVIQNTECLRMSEKVRKVLRRPQLVWNWFNMVSFNWKFVASPFLPSWPIKKNHLGNSRILECNACNVHLSQGFLETDRSLWLSVEEDQVSEDTLPLIRLFSYVFPIPNKQKH